MLQMDNLSDASVRLKILEDKTFRHKEKSQIVKRQGSLKYKELSAFTEDA